MGISVSVFVLTYNHAKYISQCLDSILSQKTHFEYEVVIHDDASTDGTTEILKEYKRKYKDRIVLILENTNKYHLGINNVINQYVIPFIKGKYVTYTDGDDFWSSDYKLQKQYDYMEAHPNCSLCTHNVFCVDKKGNVLSNAYPRKHGVINEKKIIDYPNGSFIASSSTFFRTDSYKKFDNWRLAFPVDDTPAFIQACFDGYVFKLKDSLSTYRRFSENSWSMEMKNVEKRITFNKKTILALEMINVNNHRYRKLINSDISRIKFKNAILTKDYKTVFSLKNVHFFLHLRFKTKLLLLLEYRFNWIYRKRFKQ